MNELEHAVAQIPIEHRPNVLRVDVPNGESIALLQSTYYRSFSIALDAKRQSFGSDEWVVELRNGGRFALTPGGKSLCWRFGDIRTYQNPPRKRAKRLQRQEIYAGAISAMRSAFHAAYTGTGVAYIALGWQPRRDYFEASEMLGYNYDRYAVDAWGIPFQAALLFARNVEDIAKRLSFLNLEKSRLPFDYASILETGKIIVKHTANGFRPCYDILSGVGTASVDGKPFNILSYEESKEGCCSECNQHKQQLTHTIENHYLEHFICINTECPARRAYWKRHYYGM